MSNLDMVEKENLADKTKQTAKDFEQFDELVHERHEVMRNQLERAEQKHETNTDKQEALARATKLAEKSQQEKEDSSPVTAMEQRHGAPSKKQRQSSLKSQLKQVQSEINTRDRLVSKFIHLKPLESASDLMGSTFARPNALLAGSIAAFIGVTISYFVAKYYGFQLSGFETIAAFAFGWTIGILYDYFSVMIRGRRKD